MKKILALDLGDAWVGIAISDPMGVIARPYQTVAAKEINPTLTDIIKKENIQTIIIGYPKTMKGVESAQTRKVVEQKESLEKLFPNIHWILQDERLSSQRASHLRREQGKKVKTQDEKLHAHALAAAFILDSYLSFQALQKDAFEEEA